MTPHCLTTRFTYLPLMLLALLALILQGCGDGVRVLPASDADPTGYYTNSGYAQVMTADNTTPRTDITDLQGMVYDGQLMMLSDSKNVTYVGTFSVSGNDFSGTVTVYEAGVRTQENVPLSGMITAGSHITGTLGGSGVANGSFRLNYAPLADNGPVDMNMVIHDLDWLPVNNTESFTIRIGDDAAPIANFGSGGSGQGTFDNCKFRGRLEPVPETHLYTLSGVMRDCENSNSVNILTPKTYSGLVGVRGTAPNDRLIVILTNGIYGINGEYVRQ